MADTSESSTPSTEKRPRDRSPSFPFIPLKTVVERLEAFEKYFGRHPSQTNKAGLAWRMKEKSSQANQTLAALRSFGFIRYTGVGTKRQTELTEEGRNYVRTQQELVKKQILKQCALRPKIIRKYWSIWGADRPPDAVALDQLYDASFSDGGATNFLKVYDDTISYAGLSESDKISLVDDAEHKEDDDLNLQRVTPKVGDYVQWTSGGSDQFHIPRCVTWISDDGNHARVHGSLTGIKMNELTVVDPPAPPPTGLTGKAGASMSDSNDDANDINVLLTGKRLQITADVDGKGLITLKKVLGQYEEILKLLSQPVHGAMPTDYTDDAEGREAEIRARELDDEFPGDQ